MATRGELTDSTPRAKSERAGCTGSQPGRPSYAMSQILEDGAGGGTRTHIPVRARDFESRAYASFATPAAGSQCSATGRGLATVAVSLFLMSIPWAEVRKDFPALERRVYLNTAATGLPPPTVRPAVDAFYRELEESGDARWDEWMARREGVRKRVASLSGAEAEEIAFVANTSTGMNLIVDLLATDGPLLSDELEFPAVTLPWIHRGVHVSFVPAVEGILRLESFMKPYAPRAATIAISHVQFSNGCRQDLGAFALIKDDR